MPHLLSTAQLDVLLRLIVEVCTTDQIRRVLRDAKASERDVRVSGTTDELVRHIWAARSINAISDQALIQLLREGEENGRHHSFFFDVTNNPNIKSRDPEWLLGQAEKHFPRQFSSIPHLILKPVRSILSDVRIDSSDGAVFTLVLKVYAGREVEHLTERVEYAEGDERFVRRISKLEYERLVSTVRVHSFGVMEVRVPTGLRESRTETQQQLSELVTLVDPIVPQKSCTAVDFSKALSRLVKGRATRGVDYRIEGVRALDLGATAEFGSPMEGLRALDLGATAEFGSPMEGQDLFSSERHEVAVAQYNEFEKMDVYFHSPYQRTPPRPEIRCQMCVQGRNGFRLGARLEALEADFVTKRLLRLAGYGQK